MMLENQFSNTVLKKRLKKIGQIEGKGFSDHCLFLDVHSMVLTRKLLIRLFV